MYIEFYGRTPLISSVAAGVMMDVRAETVEFVLASRQGQLNLADYIAFVKSATPMYSWLDKKKVEAEDLGDGRIRIEWAIDRGNTNEKTLNVQLQFEAENAEVVWQTEIVKFNFSGTVDVDEEMPKQYPSIVQTFEATAADLKAEAEQLSGEFTDFKGEVETNLNEFRDELHSNATSFVFNTYEELQEALSAGSTPFDGTAKVGDSLWIKDVDVPDYWVSGVDPYEISEAEAGGLIKNISDGTGTGSLNQIQDGTGGTFDFTNKNPNATAIDPTLTGNIPYGAIGDFSTSLGGKSSAQGKRSTAKGTTTIAKGKHSSAEGDNSVSLGDDSHAEGNKTTSVGLYSHSEGLNTVSKGLASHAEGAHTLAGGAAAHAQGASTTANGDYSFAGGRACTATTEAAFAFGRNVLSRGNYSAVFGYNTKNDPSAAIGVLIAGAYNESKPDMVLEIGNGTSEGSRRNAFEVTTHGNARAYGTPSAYNDLTPKRYVDSITNSKVDRTTTINKKPLTSNITLTADDVGALKNTTKYGATLTLDIDPNTFILTARLKDQDGNILGKEQQIDLPLETMVVNATYDSSSKEIILTLQNGNTTRVPVGDLVDGLVTEEYVGEHYVELISSPNKFVYGGQGGNPTTYGASMSPANAELPQYNNTGHLKSNDPEEPLDVVNLDYAQNNYVDINSEQYIYGTKHFYDVINVQKDFTDTTRNSVQVGIDNTGGFISLWGKKSGMAGVNSTHILIEDNEGNPPHKLAFPTSWVKPDTAFATETIATEEKLQYLFFSELPLSGEQKEILVNSGAINYLSDEVHNLLSVVGSFYIQFPARLIETMPVTLYFHKDEELDYNASMDDRYVFSCRHSDSDVFMLVYNASPNGNRLLTFDRIKLPDYSTVQLSLNDYHINNLVTNGHTSELEDEFHSILTSKDIFYIHFAPGTIGSSDRNFYFRKTEYFTTTDDTPVTHYIFKSIYNNDKIYTLNYIPSPDRYLEMSITSGSVDTGLNIENGIGELSLQQKLRSDTFTDSNNFTKEETGGTIISGAVGDYSFVVNCKGRAEGVSSFVANSNGYAKGDRASVFGNHNRGYGANSFVAGNQNLVTGENAAGFGLRTRSLNLGSFTTGIATVAYSEYGYSEGYRTESGAKDIDTAYSFTIGIPFATDTLGSIAFENVYGGDVSGDFQVSDGSGSVIDYYEGTNNQIDTVNYDAVSHTLTFHLLRNVTVGDIFGLNSGSTKFLMPDGKLYVLNSDYYYQYVDTRTFTGWYYISKPTPAPEPSVELDENTVIGFAAHSEGWMSKAPARASHAEGQNTLSGGIGSHTEGENTKTLGKFSHAGGYGSLASADYSFVHGYVVGSNKENQVVFGKYNKNDAHADFIVGDGSKDEHRNAFWIEDGQAFVRNVSLSEKKNNQLMTYSNVNDLIQGFVSNMVTTDTTQLITGRKRFTARTSFVNTENDASTILDSDGFEHYDGSGYIDARLEDVRLSLLDRATRVVDNAVTLSPTSLKFSTDLADTLFDIATFGANNKDKIAQISSGLASTVFRFEETPTSSYAVITKGWADDNLVTTNTNQTITAMKIFREDIVVTSAGTFNSGTDKFVRINTQSPNVSMYDGKDFVYYRPDAVYNLMGSTLQYPWKKLGTFTLATTDDIPDTSTFVTTDTTQTISGQKTFTSAVAVNTNSNNTVFFSAFDSVTNGGATLRSRPTYTALSVYGNNSTLKTYDTGIYANSFIQYVRDTAYLRLLFPDPDPTTSEIVTETIATQEYVAKAIANAITTTLNTAV